MDHKIHAKVLIASLLVVLLISSQSFGQRLKFYGGTGYQLHFDRGITIDDDELSKRDHRIGRYFDNPLELNFGVAWYFASSKNYFFLVGADFTYAKMTAASDVKRDIYYSKELEVMSFCANVGIGYNIKSLLGKTVSLKIGFPTKEYQGEKKEGEFTYKAIFDEKYFVRFDLGFEKEDFIANNINLDYGMRFELGELDLPRVEIFENDRKVNTINPGKSPYKHYDNQLTFYISVAYDFVF